MMTPLEKGIERMLRSDVLTEWERVVTIIALMDEHYHARLNKLAEMLDERTTELQRLQRLVGEEA